MSPDEAIDIIARNCTHYAVEDWTQNGWENLPDFTEADYQRIVSRMQQLLPVTSIRVDQAQTVLEMRTGSKEDSDA